MLLLLCKSILGLLISMQNTLQEASDDNGLIIIKFEMYSPDLAKDTSVFITGSDSRLGNWNPSRVQMKSVGDHKWVFELKCKPNYPIEYKYTQGSWKVEAAGADGRPRQNFAVQSNTDKIVKDRISFWTTGDTLPVQGKITGTVKYHRQMEADGILPRDIVVWLPPGYQNSGKQYPVLYMHDGQNLFDPETSSFGVDWQADETCTQLIKAKKIQPPIMVGIYNTPDRTKEYLPGETGRAYARFIVSDLKPFIDKHYRTKSDRDHTSIGGSSFGGICAFMLAWEHPTVFSKAICFSPAFSVQKEDGSISDHYVKTFEDSELADPVPYFYLYNGGIGLEHLLQPGIDKVLDAMKQKGMAVDKDYTWKFTPDARHSESAWAKQLPDALQLLFATD